MKIIVGMVLGAIVILGSVTIPSPFPIGMYWSLGLAIVFGMLSGLVSEVDIGPFVIGVVVGYLAVVIYSFPAWAHLSFLLAVIHLGTVTVAITSFIISNEKRKSHT